MKLKNSEIIRALNSLNEIENKEMPVEMTFKVLDIFQALTDKYIVYEQTLNKLNGDEEKIQELLEIENEISVAPFLMQDFVNAGITLTPLQAFGLKVLIDGEHTNGTE